MAHLEPSELIPIEIPQPEWSIHRIAHKAELLLLRFALRLIKDIRTPFIEAQQKAYAFFFENTAEQIKPLVMPFLDRIDEIPNLPVEIKGAIADLRSTEPLTLTAIGVAVIMAAIVGLAMGIVHPFQKWTAQQTDNLVRSARLAAPDAYVAAQRGAISPEQFLDQMKDGGWSDYLIKAWKDILRPLLSLDDWSELFLRKEIPEGTWSAELTKRGFEPEQIGQVRKLLEIIPPINDIIRFAVREAFTPEIVQEFQLEAELPGAFIEWANKKGLGEIWTKAYWASHWQLPSLNMGYEMLHRGEIKEHEMQMLIKAHDVSPFWRDKLLAISYNLYTRVDTRRMYQVGVLGEEEVFENYRGLGYDEEKARNLTDFTIAVSNATERDLTKSEILYGRRELFFSFEEMKGLLIDIGYDENEVDYYEAKIQYDHFKAYIKEATKYIQKMYVSMQIDQPAAYNQLGELNLPAEQTNKYIRLWSLERQRKISRPPKTDLIKFFTTGVIKEDAFKLEMSGHGYSEKYIGWYIKFITAAMEES